MEKIGLNKLRAIFLEFYKNKDHYLQKSFSLIPDKDKSLLIINSGMAPLKPYFAGIETPPSRRCRVPYFCLQFNSPVGGRHYAVIFRRSCEKGIHILNKH